MPTLEIDKLVLWYNQSSRPYGLVIFDWLKKAKRQIMLTVQPIKTSEWFT